MAIKIQHKPFQLDSLQTDLRSLAQVGERSGEVAKPGASGGFTEMLKKGLEDVNSSLAQSEGMSQDLASGKSSNLHETMLAATKAELGFHLMVQLRNKAIESYQEVMRMQI